MAMLENKTALVTGGRQGIGRGIADRFAAEGASVTITGRGARPDDLPPHFAWVSSDVSDPGAVAELAAGIEGLDVLVNNAGIQIEKTITETSDADWDLLMGANNSQIATLVERHTRYVMLARVKGKDSETVINALIKQAHKLPGELYKSLTWDRGKEMHDHKRFTLTTDIKVYFCDPQSPWQRGSNENTNGLLRQYFPKGMDLSNIHQNRLNAVARRLNERPRETLNFETPAERFNQCGASIDRNRSI